METLATVVFERTPRGAAAIKLTNDEVPRRLRTLLLAVDGRSPVAQYVPFLTALAPLSEKFAELEALGYLQRKGSVGADAVERFERAQNSGFGALLPRIDAKSPASGFVPIQFADLRELASSPAAAQISSHVNAFELELQALARQMSGASSPAVQAPASLPTAHAAELRLSPAPTKPQLPDLLYEMERFLTASAGDEALPAIVMLGQIKTLSQLRAELPGYLDLVTRYGPQADPHIERLAGLLDQTGH